MPVLFAASGWSAKSRRAFRFPFSSSRARRTDCRSTAPPPTVPSAVPSAKTAMCAPAPRGEEPSAFRMLQSITPSPRVKEESIVFKISFIALSFIKNGFWVL